MVLLDKNVVANAHAAYLRGDGAPPSNRKITWRQVHIYRVTETQVVEHWAVRDDLRVLEAIDAPDDPAALVRARAGRTMAP